MKSLAPLNSSAVAAYDSTRRKGTRAEYGPSSTDPRPCGPVDTRLKKNLDSMCPCVGLSFGLGRVVCCWDVFASPSINPTFVCPLPTRQYKLDTTRSTFVSFLPFPI